MCLAGSVLVFVVLMIVLYYPQVMLLQVSFVHYPCFSRSEHTGNMHLCVCVYVCVYVYVYVCCVVSIHKTCICAEFPLELAVMAAWLQFGGDRNIDSGGADGHSPV